MIICPFCSEENIDGVDECAECGQPLDFLSKPRPSSSIERSLTKDRVYMLSPQKPVAVDAATPVRDVLKLLADHKIGCVVVVQNHEMVGIFTERDALMRLNTEAAALGDRPIADFMTPSPETVDLDASIAFALHKMDIGGYRHIPVLSDGKTSGVISVRDILRYITEDLLSASRS
jgi:CBS domain-containing protein